MGTSHLKLTGPDLKKGIFQKDIEANGKVLGHADGEPVLLVKHGGDYYAISALCSHYGANLNEGIVTGQQVHCPWHHACFNLKTGEAEKAPAFHPLDTWKVEVAQGKVFVKDKKSREEPLERPSTIEHIAIVGSGAAGHAAAEMLRRKGFSGRISIYSEDSDLPYDRPNLSKGCLQGHAPEEWLPLHPVEFYTEKNISIHIHSPVIALDVHKKTLTLKSGQVVSFDKCLLATGGSPIKPAIEGIDLPHVHFLRSLQDCKNLIQSLEGKKSVTIIGAGFIGLECAASLRSRGIQVTIIAPESLPLARIVGKTVASYLKKCHEQKGVQFKLERMVVKILSQHVELNDGSRVPTQLVLVATGIKPNDTLAANAGIKCDNGILVNQYLESSVADIFAAGDVARWPYTAMQKQVRIEHWAVAQRLGQVAALNMLGERTPYKDIPFFWTRQYDLSLSYVGHAESWNKLEFYGSLENGNAAVAYWNQDDISAVLTVGRDDLSLQIAHALENDRQSEVKKLLQRQR